MTELEIQNLALLILDQRREKLSQERLFEKEEPKRFALEDFLLNSPKRRRSARARPPS